MAVAREPSRVVRSVVRWAGQKAACSAPQMVVPKAVQRAANSVARWADLKAVKKAGLMAA